MKVPTMDQLRIRHELAMAGAHEEWEALFNECVAYGRACGQMLFKPATTETYGRGDTPAAVAFARAEATHVALWEPVIEACYARWYRSCDWDDMLTLADFPLTALASAVALYRGDSA